MASYNIPFWKEAPFIRVVIPFIVGIVVSRYMRTPPIFYELGIVGCAVCLVFFYFLNLKWQYYLRVWQGVFLNLLIVCFGTLCGQINNPFKSEGIIEKIIGDKRYVASIEEPPVERNSSYKTTATLVSIQRDSVPFNADTRVLLYFKKSQQLSIPSYGTTIAFKKQPIPITNFIEGFDYKKYCALKNIHYQLFLGPGDFVIVDTTSGNALLGFIYRCQDWVITTLRRFIPGKKECGLAEALLIGYKNDLDRSLIQSYSNTGVVHVVAISGLHLGLIYALLNFFCGALNSNQAKKVSRAVIMLTGLWMFSLLAGGSPSVLRSAVMFSFIVIGESFLKTPSLLNSLSASAFVLLCYNPYWLWDLGFILSYGALLSILIFQKPVYHLCAAENKLIHRFWKMNSVTLAAQILTMPVLIYYFRQFPNLFLITNFIAIPLSSFILVSELLLCAVSFIPWAAVFTGKVIALSILGMNSVVEYMDSFSFSSTKGLNINFIQLILLYVFIAFMYQWLIGKRKQGLPCALISLIVFFLVVLHPFKATR